MTTAEKHQNYLNNSYDQASLDALGDLDNLKQAIEMHAGLTPTKKTQFHTIELQRLSKQIEMISADFADTVEKYDEA